jgi:CheY-like chemotaxis protein
MAKVLLADDSITMQKVIELVLAGEGFEVKTASNGGDALSYLSSFKPDIVLADIEMPEINGYELAEKIKGDPETNAIPVILLAGAFEPMDESRVKISGADDTLIKPFESSDLLEKINNLLSARLTEEQFAEEGEALAAEPVAAEEGEELWDLTEEAVEAEPVEEALEEAIPAEEAAAEEALPKEEEIWEEGIIEEPPVEAACEVPEEEEKAPVVETAAMEMPGAEELSGIFKEAVHDRLSEFLNTVDIKGVLIEALEPSIKDSVEKILWELTPDLTEKLLKETLGETMVSLKKELENVIWETVPDLAESIIRKEIDRIRAEST